MSGGGIPEPRTERRALKSLVPASYNPRKISLEAFKGLRASIRKFGLVQPIVLNERTGNVVGGHQRLKAMIAEGEVEADVVIVDLPDTEERALNIAMNSPALQGEFIDELGPLLASIQEEGDLELFEELRLEELFPSVTEAAEELPAVDPEEVGSNPKHSCPLCGFQF